LGLEALIALKDTGLKADISESWDLKILHEPELSVKATGIVPIAVDSPCGSLALEFEVLFEGVFEN